jgi:hypothetical protein
MTSMKNAFKQCEHICNVYETEEEQLATAAEYLSDGLRAGERVFYVASSADALNRFNRVLKEAGINVEAMLKRGALVQATHADAHLVDNRFDSERMLRLLNDAVEAALNDRFTGLRTCGDMSWLLQEPEGAEQVLEYEALLNEFFQGVRAAGMCQYDRQRLAPHLVDHALATHSSVVIDRHHTINPFYTPAFEAATRPTADSDLDWKLRELRRGTY